MPPISQINISSRRPCISTVSSQRPYTHWHNQALHCSPVCYLSNQDPPKTAPKTSSPLSPLTCHSAFLYRPPDWIFLSFFLLFSSDICSIQRLHHGTTIVLFSTHILVLTCHIFGGFGILAPDLNLDIFWDFFSKFSTEYTHLSFFYYYKSQIYYKSKCPYKFNLRHAIITDDLTEVQCL